MQEIDVKKFLNGANYRRVKSRRQKIKDELIKYKGGKCQRCGYDKCNEALEFHHLDPSKKDFTLSSSDVLSLERMKEEVDKCILVCANCHREIHHEEYEKIRENTKKEEEKVFSEIMRNRDKYDVSRVTNSYKYLSEAGIFEDIEKNATRSDICKKYHINNRTFNRFLKENGIAYREKKVVKNKPNKEELTKLLETQSKSSVARMFGVSWNSVQKWCKKYGI